MSLSFRSQRRWEDENCVLLRDSVRKFFAEWIPAHEMRWREHKQVDRAFWLEAGSMGLLTPSIPAQYGGSGGDFRFDAILSEELGYAASTSFIGQSIHGTIVAHYLLNYGSEQQKQEWLPEMASGKKIAAIAMTEPGGGSDLKALKTSAQRDNDAFVINGSKTFITNGMLADLVLVAARTSSDPSARGISLIMVETEHLSGFSRGRNLDKVGMKGSDTAELFFNDVRVPLGNLVGEEGSGFAMMMQQLPQERLSIAVGAQAMMERGIELTLDYVRERKAFGQAVANFQNTRFKLAECVTQATISRSFLDDCIVRHTAGELSTAEASMAKYHVTDLMNRVLDECVQLHGGYGYMEEYPISRLWVDGRVQRIYGGTNEIMKDIIARDLF